MCHLSVTEKLSCQFHVEKRSVTSTGQRAEMTHFTFMLVCVPEHELVLVTRVLLRMCVRHKNKQFFCLEVFDFKREKQKQYLKHHCVSALMCNVMLNA